MFDRVAVFTPVNFLPDLAIRKPDLLKQAKGYGVQNRALNSASTVAEKTLDMLHGWPSNPRRAWETSFHIQIWKVCNFFGTWVPAMKCAATAVLSGSSFFTGLPLMQGAWYTG